MATGTIELGDYTLEDDSNDDLLIKDSNANTVLQIDSSVPAWKVLNIVFDLNGQDLENSGTTVYDASADTVGDGSNTTADHTKVTTGELNGGVTGNTALTDITGSNLSINSGSLDATGDMAVNQVSSNTTTSGAGIYLVDTSGGAVTLTLASNDASNEESIGVVNITGSNNVTVDTESTETIDPGGASSKTLSTEGWLVWFNGDGTNWDSSLDVDVESMTTDEANITNETFVRATRGTANTGISSGTFTNIADGESKDVRSEFNSSAQFVPDQSGEYLVVMNVDIENGSTGDQIVGRIRNVDAANNVQGSVSVEHPTSSARHQFVFIVNLTAGTTYEMQVTNLNSSFDIGTDTVAEIVRSVVA